MRSNKTNSFSRDRLIIVGLLPLLVLFVFVGRLFQLQVVQHDYYQAQALSEHLKKQIIPASRGEIYAWDKDSVTPLVYNQTFYTLYADPSFVDNPDETAQVISRVLKVDTSSIRELLSVDGRYVVLDRKLEKKKADAIENLKLSGIGLTPQSYRSYPEGSLAAQVLGFVNHEYKGQYGIEGSLDDRLSGIDGLLNAQVDVRGIPISTVENILVEPEKGDDIVLTIDRNIQAKVEEALKSAVKSKKAKSASAIVIDSSNGRIKAMGNYPTFHPAKYQEVDDYKRFQNQAVEYLYEPGSIMKLFTMAAGLNEGAVTPKTEYYDKEFEIIDGYRVKNAVSVGAQTRNMTDVIAYSVNTGVIHVLRQLGGSEDINDQGKQKLYDYLYNKFRFGQKTGIELPNEPQGSIDKPEDRSAIGYANISFGQGMNASLVQLASAYTAIANGGTIYRPTIVSGVIEENKVVTNDPQVIESSVISPDTSRQLVKMMKSVVDNGGGYIARNPGYDVVGKTATAQIPSEDGGYKSGVHIGSFAGFTANTDNPYVVVVRIDEPNIYGHAGSNAAAPLFADINNWLINYMEIPPKR